MLHNSSVRKKRISLPLEFRHQQDKLFPQDGKPELKPILENDAAKAASKKTVDAGVYTGDKSGDKKHGKGELKYDNGDVYDGPWINDKRHGTSGSYVFSAGDIYVGDWADGYVHGKGVFVFAQSEDEDPPADLWVRGACLRLVPSSGFQLGDSHDDDKAFKKSSFNNMLNDWNQIIGIDNPPPSGIFTAEVLRERLLSEADTKSWLSWLYFCTKWEKSVYGAISVFLAFPDVSRGVFLSLTQVITSSGLLEKLVMKYTSASLGSSISVGEANDSEIQKLFALSLDIDEDEPAIQHIIKLLKSTRDSVKPSALPPYFSHSLAHTLSIFKKPTSSALHFLNQKTLSLEKKLLGGTPAPLSASAPQVHAQPAQKPAPPQRASVPHPSSSSHTPPTTLALLKLLLQFYRERADLFPLFEKLETAPKVVEKIIGTSSVLQEFVERKISFLERDDALFIEDMDSLQDRGHFKGFEEDEKNASKYLDMYYTEKASVFRAVANEHKKDVQMMEQVRKSCEELYGSLYNKMIHSTFNSFTNCKSILDKLASGNLQNTDHEVLDILDNITRFVLRQLNDLHRIVTAQTPFNTDVLGQIETYTKDLTQIADKITQTIHPSATPTPTHSTSYFGMALSITKGLFRNVTQYALNDDSKTPQSKVEEHTFQPINISTLEKESALLKTLLRDHTDAEIISHIAASTLSHLAENPSRSISKDLIAAVILCLQDCQSTELRAACLKLLNSHFGQDDEHRKEFSDNFVNVLVGTLDSAIKDPAPFVGPELCELLANLTNGPPEVKSAVVSRLGIKKVIDLMDSGARHPHGEAVVHGAAQVLANLSSKEEYLVEISGKGGLVRVLEVAKLGKLKVSAHIPENQLKFGETLGTGTFAEVKRATWQDKQVAVKIFKEAAFTFRLEDFWKEVAIMSLIKHDNILRLLGASIAPRKENSTFMLITEFMEKGTLRDIIRRVGPFPAPLIVKYALEIARGLAYMHTLDVLHRDIKASNILVDEKDIAKVGDLGLSRVSNSLGMTQLTGTPKWEAPECLVSSQYSKSADVYSYGVVLSEMVTGEEPFPEINEMAELKKAVVDQKQRPKLPPKAPNCPEYLQTIIKACWSHEPKKRPSFEQIIEKLSAPPQ